MAACSFPASPTAHASSYHEAWHLAAFHPFDVALPSSSDSYRVLPSVALLDPSSSLLPGPSSSDDLDDSDSSHGIEDPFLDYSFPSAVPYYGQMALDLAVVGSELFLFHWFLNFSVFFAPFQA